MDKATARAIGRLKNYFPLVGPWLKVKGAVALIGTGEPEAVLLLVDALSDKKQEVRETAYQALTQLNGVARDRLCSLWADGRDERLENIIVECGYVATEPLDLMYLTSLKLGKLEELPKADRSRIDIISKLLHDQDAEIATNAEKILLSLTNQTDINHLCSLWADGRDERLENIIVECGYVATEPLDLMYLTSLKLGKLEELPKADRSRIDIIIIKKLLHDRDAQIATNAQKALHSLKNQTDINHLCSLWADGRDKRLENIVLDRGYVASEPLLLMALTSFLQGKKLTVMLAEEVLRACLSDMEKTIVKGAADYVIENKKEQGCAALWAFSKEHPASLWPKALHAKGWRPDNKLDCALFYLLAGDLAHYRGLDFNQSYLRDLYKRGSQALKEAITARIKESGDAELREASFTIQEEIRPRGILCVDDEESCHLLWKEELEYEGYIVHTAISGEEALKIFDLAMHLGKPQIDLVILDINMPGMDGIEVLREMKQKKPSIPVILCSAYPEYKQDMTSWASDDYIVKSFNLDDLQASVRRLLRK